MSLRYQRECAELSEWLQSALERLEFWNTQAVLVPQELETVRDHLSAFLVRLQTMLFCFLFFFFFLALIQRFWLFSSNSFTVTHIELLELPTTNTAKAGYLVVPLFIHIYIYI